MKHYYLICYRAPNFTTQRMVLHITRHELWKELKLWNYEIYAITRLSKKEYREISK